LDIDVAEVAAREAYLAALHGAQALIAERTGRTVKRHHGVHTEFAGLTREEPRLDPELRQFLPRSYNLKTVADYEVGDQDDISEQQALAAIETATRFVTCIEGILS